jgi:hypothetical protein
MIALLNRDVWALELQCPDVTSRLRALIEARRGVAAV